jgi:U3 small nucleolar RNA-associated protein 12
MSMKTYLRYVLDNFFGVIASQTANSIVDTQGQHIITPTVENVCVWNVRRAEKVQSFKGENGEVTRIDMSHGGLTICAGYSDGCVRTFAYDPTQRSHTEDSLKLKLNGHRKGVSALCFSPTDTHIASGARDTQIIVWDVLAEHGLFRLQGHKDEITDMFFLRKRGMHALGDNESQTGDEISQMWLVSSSKDTTIKVWDLHTQHCMQTLVGHRSEVWSIGINPEGTRMISGSSENQLQVWSVKDSSKKNYEESSDEDDVLFELKGVLPRVTRERVAMIRFSKTSNLCGVQSAGKTLEIFRMRTAEEVKKKMARREKRSREKGRKKKSAGETQDAATTEDVEGGDEVDSSAAQVATLPSDEIELDAVFRHQHKIRSFSFVPETLTEKTADVALALVNNTVEFHTIKLDTYDVDSPKTADDVHKQLHSIAMHGHRTDIRAMALSSDDRLLATASSGMLKVWNVRTGQCLRSMEAKFCLCCAFLPGDRAIVCGNKAGGVQVFDVNNGVMSSEYTPHTGSVWSLSVRPDLRGLMTGSADHDVKFFDFELMEPDGATASSTQALGLVHTRTLKMASDVLCVKFSNTRDPAKLLVICALLDCTVKVFFDDSLKFYLSLYGHKLPVLSLDISSDNNLLATASADKNIKLWGLDFGDCHKSIFAHDDSVMGLAFVPKTHYFFSVGKDKSVKYWDGDHFEQILSLESSVEGGNAPASSNICGHRAEVWCLAVSRNGGMVITAGHDRSIRVWTRTDEPVFLQEEQEKRMEEMFESELNRNEQKSADQSKSAETGLDVVGAPKSDFLESASARKRSVETVKGGERIMEALNVADLEQIEIDKWNAANKPVRSKKNAAGDAATNAGKTENEQNEKEANAEGDYIARALEEQKQQDAAEREKKAEVAAKKTVRQPNYIMLGLTPVRYVLRTLKNVRPQELEEALLVLSYASMQRLLFYLKRLVEDGVDIELCSRCVFHLLRHHQKVISANVSDTMVQTLTALQHTLRKQLKKQKDRMGMNLAGMEYMLASLKEGKNLYMTTEEDTPQDEEASGMEGEGGEDVDKGEKKKKKRKGLVKVAHVAAGDDGSSSTPVVKKSKKSKGKK